MKDDELRDKLRQWRVPEASESARARSRHRALLAFRQRGFTAPELSGWRKFILCGGSVAALVVALGLSQVFLQHHAENSAPDVVVRSQQNVPENLANDRKILQQMQELFPNQVEAVVQKNGKTDLSITQSPAVGTAQPIVVVFQRGKESIRVLSYSGHHVCINLGNAHRCFDILETPGGGVMLESETQVWITSQHPMVEGYAVRGQTLEASL